MHIENLHQFCCVRWCNPMKATSFCCWLVLIVKHCIVLSNVENPSPIYLTIKIVIHMVKICIIASVWCKLAKNSRRWRHSSCTIANLSAAAGQIVPQLIAQPNLFSFWYSICLVTRQVQRGKKERSKCRRWSISHIYGSISDNDMLILTRITQYHTFRYGRGSRPFSYSFVNLTAKMDWLGGSRIVQHGEI